VRKILLALTAATIMTGSAVAGERLTDQQMDGVTAGFTAYSGNPNAQALTAIVASVTTTVGSTGPLVSRDNFPPSAFTQPTEQNPFQVYRLPSSPSGTTVYTCGICFMP